MTKQELERLVPIAINHPAHGPARLELKRYKENGKFICIAQYRDNNWGCSNGTSGKNWNEVSKKLLNDKIWDLSKKSK